MEPVIGKGDTLELNSDLVLKVIPDFIRDALSSAGFKRGVVGLSGGVDSSLVAYLATASLGKENVLGVIMPYRSSSPQSKEDAETVARNLGISHETIDITPMVDPHLTRVGNEDRVRSGNIMARERMIILYDLSTRENALVIGTSNKTESLLGYGTIYGDMACAVNPLGDLYKTQVWKLAKEVGVPAEIVGKTPSADLWTGQSDEAELGFTYRDVDRLLYAMIDERKSESELLELGFEADFIGKIQKLIRRNQFKRRPPLIAKVSSRTTNIDFRYPRDWGM